MRAHSVGRLGLSLIGFFALVQALVIFPYLATWGIELLRGNQSPVLVVLTTILPFALLILLGVVLVTNPDRIARALAQGEGEGDREIPVVSVEIAQVLFAATGVLIFAGAIPDLFRGAVTALRGAQDLRFQALAGAVARALLGVVLFFRPRAVLDFWRRTQPGGDAEPGGDGTA